jgi:hypothetical protein
MIHGPDIDQMRNRAKALVQAAFVYKAEQDGTQPTLRAMYVRKAEQAQVVLAGGSSALIEGEAALRGITPEQMAQVIISMAAAGGDDIELARIETNLKIEAATSESAIIAVMDALGIPFTLAL